MDINIQAIKFDATEKLQNFINKRIGKLSKFYEGITNVDVSLKVIKPETAANKEVSIKVTAPHIELFASKIADSFEDATDLCAEAIQKQLAKAKEKNQ